METPYTPLLYPTRREPTSTRLSTAFLSGLLVVVILNCLLTAEAILSSYQIQFAVRRFRDVIVLFYTTNSGPCRPLDQPSVFCPYHYHH